jgi:hypothetical protein
MRPQEHGKLDRRTVQSIRKFGYWFLDGCLLGAQNQKPFMGLAGVTRLARLDLEYTLAGTG